MDQNIANLPPEAMVMEADIEAMPLSYGGFDAS